MIPVSTVLASLRVHGVLIPSLRMMIGVRSYSDGFYFVLILETIVKLSVGSSVALVTDDALSALFLICFALALSTLL
jgi:hypothetical protein